MGVEDDIKLSYAVWPSRAPQRINRFSRMNTRERAADCVPSHHSLLLVRDGDTRRKPGHRGSERSGRASGTNFSEAFQRIAREWTRERFFSGHVID